LVALEDVASQDAEDGAKATEEKVMKESTMVATKVRVMEAMVAEEKAAWARIKMRPATFWIKSGNTIVEEMKRREFAESKKLNHF